MAISLLTNQAVLFVYWDIELELSPHYPVPADSYSGKDHIFPSEAQSDNDTDWA